MCVFMHTGGTRGLYENGKESVWTGGKETPPPTSVQVTTPTGCSPSLSMKEMRGSVI